MYVEENFCRSLDLETFVHKEKRKIGVPTQSNRAIPSNLQLKVKTLCIQIKCLMQKKIVFAICLLLPLSTMLDFSLWKVNNLRINPV